MNQIKFTSLWLQFSG